MSEPTLNDLPIRRTTTRYAIARREIPTETEFPFARLSDAWEALAVSKRGGYVVEQRTTVTLRVMDAC